MESFVFLQTHVSATDVSFGDYLYEIGYDNMDAIVAIRLDGRMTAIQGNAISKEYPFEYEGYFREVLKNGMDKEHAEYYAKDILMSENGLGVVELD